MLAEKGRFRGRGSDRALTFIEDSISTKRRVGGGSLIFDIKLRGRIFLKHLSTTEEEPIG